MTHPGGTVDPSSDRPAISTGKHRRRRRSDEERTEWPKTDTDHPPPDPLVQPAAAGGGLWSQRALLQAVAAGLLWAIVLFVFLVQIWGSPARTSFQSPDEALTRFAIERVADTGTPALVVPFDDAEDLVHPRLWVTIDGRPVPTHPPFLFYLYGGFERALPGGEWVVFLLPAVGLGAFVAAAFLLLPRHRWTALFLPGLMFPATYRLLRPWSNIAAMLALLGLALFFWALWKRTDRGVPLYAGLALVGVAAAVRPDQVHLIIGVSLLATLSQMPTRRWGWALGIHAFVVIAVVGIVLAGNVALTGSLVTSPVDSLEGAPGTELAGRSLPTPLRELAVVLIPKGIPSGEEIVTQTRKFWWELGPVNIITVAALVALVFAAIRLIRRRAYSQLALGVLGVMLVVLFFLTRINSTDFGASAPLPGVRFSLARYSVVVYAAAAMLVLSLATYTLSIKRRTTLSLLLLVPTMVAGILGLRYIYSGEPTQSLAWFIDQRSELESYPMAVDATLSEKAILYVRFRDKYVWSSRLIGLLPTEPGPAKRHLEYDALVRSIDKATDAGFVPYLTELTPEEVDELGERLEVSGRVLESDFAGSWQVWLVASMGQSP